MFELKFEIKQGIFLILKNIYQIPVHTINSGNLTLWEVLSFSFGLICPHTLILDNKNNDVLSALYGIC